MKGWAKTPDIAVNLTDPMYRGEYHGKNRHEPDIEAVVQRARDAGVERILITGTSMAESRDALSMAKRYSESSGRDCSDGQICTVPPVVIQRRQTKWRRIREDLSSI